MSGQNPLKKNYPSAKCQHCGKITDLTYNHDINHLIAQNKTLSQNCKIERHLREKIQRSMNSQGQVYHKVHSKMIKMLTHEQINELKSESQWLRDRLKEIEKEMVK